MFNVPNWSKVANPYYYKNINSQQLLITVGDSWTYGDSLGKTCVREGQDDTEHRLEHVYGSLIANELNSDWINLALPGISNRQMFIWLEQLLSRHIHRPSDTICIITLTESGRHEEIEWLDRSLGTLQANLENMVQKNYKWIAEIKKRHPAIKFVIAHNFTDSGTTNLDLCDRTWLEVLTNSQIQNKTHIVVSEHIQQLNYQYTYPDTPDIIDRALSRINLLDTCKYCHRHDSRHPTEYGHELWANYLLGKLC